MLVTARRGRDRGFLRSSSALEFAADSPKPTQVVLGILSVVLGWFVVHTMAGLHYAYEFYESPRADGKGGKDRSNISGGLDWPEGEPPNGSAFLYLVAARSGAALQISDTPGHHQQDAAAGARHTISLLLQHHAGCRGGQRGDPAAGRRWPTLAGR